MMGNIKLSQSQTCLTEFTLSQVTFFSSYLKLWLFFIQKRNNSSYKTKDILQLGNIHMQIDTTLGQTSQWGW